MSNLPTEIGVYLGYFGPADEVVSSEYNCVVRVSGRAPYLRIISHAINESGINGDLSKMADHKGLLFGPKLNIAITV